MTLINHARNRDIDHDFDFKNVELCEHNERVIKMTTGFTPSRKRKGVLKEQAEMMRQAKIAAVTSSVDAREFDERPGPLQPSGELGPECLNPKCLMPKCLISL